MRPRNQQLLTPAEVAALDLPGAVDTLERVMSDSGPPANHRNYAVYSAFFGATNLAARVFYGRRMASYLCSVPKGRDTLSKRALIRVREVNARLQGFPLRLEPILEFRRKTYGLLWHFQRPAAIFRMEEETADALAGLGSLPLLNSTSEVLGTIREIVETQDIKTNRDFQALQEKGYWQAEFTGVVKPYGGLPRLIADLQDFESECDELWAQALLSEASSGP